MVWMIRSGNARAKPSFVDPRKSAHRFACRALHSRAWVKRAIAAGACSGSIAGPRLVGLCAGRARLVGGYGLSTGERLRLALIRALIGG
jgi:hypothetical protein